MKNKIVELPACILSQISGGADKLEPKKPEPQPDNEVAKKTVEIFQTKAFWEIWNWD